MIFNLVLSSFTCIGLYEEVLLKSTTEDLELNTSHFPNVKMKASYYLAAQNFVAPSVNENEIHQKSFRQDDNNEILCANNIMFDSRVCRGNTYATPVLTEDQRRHHEFYERTQKARRSLIQKRKKEVCYFDLL